MKQGENTLQHITEEMTTKRQQYNGIKKKYTTHSFLKPFLINPVSHIGSAPFPISVLVCGLLTKQGLKTRGLFQEVGYVQILRMST